MTTLQTLYAQPDLSIFKYQIDDAFKRLEFAKEKITLCHDRFMSHEDSEEAYDEWYDQVEDSYSTILQAYSQYFNKDERKASTTATEVSKIYKAGTYTTDLLTQDEKLQFKLFDLCFDPQKEWQI